MTSDETEIIGKSVKDIYGSVMGKVVGTITDIDGTIQSVGVDCGSRGLQMIPDDQLVVQGDVVIFIPKWRLDSQRLIREKQLTLRRLRAMIEIATENDEMREDAVIIREKYRTKLTTLREAEAEIKAKLDARLAELDEQSQSARMLVFDAKIQYKSNEITESTFETAKSSTTEMMEHMEHEIAEISNIKERILGLETEVQDIKSTQMSSTAIQQLAISYLESAPGEEQEALSSDVAADPAAVGEKVPVAAQVSTDGSTRVLEPAVEPPVTHAPVDVAATSPVATAATTPVEQEVAPTQDTPRATSTPTTTEATDVKTSLENAGGLPAEQQLFWQGEDQSRLATDVPSAESTVDTANGVPDNATASPTQPTTTPAAEDAHEQTIPDFATPPSELPPVTSQQSTDAEVVFPEPPRQPTARHVPRRDDDDWLTRMESQ